MEWAASIQHSQAPWPPTSVMRDILCPEISNGHVRVTVTGMEAFQSAMVSDHVGGIVFPLFKSKLLSSIHHC